MGKFLVADRERGRAELEQRNDPLRTRRHADWAGREWRRLFHFFYVENILELLDSPMEWYRRGDELYYMPPTKQDNLASAEAVPNLVGGGVLEVLVNVSGARNVTLRGLSFTHTKITTLEPYLVPSCGDWAMHVGGAVLASPPGTALDPSPSTWCDPSHLGRRSRQY